MVDTSLSCIEDSLFFQVLAECDLHSKYVWYSTCNFTIPHSKVNLGPLAVEHDSAPFDEAKGRF